MSNAFARRVQNTPHPCNLPIIKRLWLDATDPNRFVLNGSDVQTWIGKLNSSLSVVNTVSVNQPLKSGEEVDWDDALNDQWLTAGGNYLFVPASEGGVSLFALIKNDQISPGGGQFKVAFDFGNYNTYGWGFRYASNEIGVYTPIAVGGTETLKRPVNNPTTGYVVAGAVITFGSDQKLYIDNAVEAQANITTPQLTATEINEQSTRGGSGGPVTVGSGSKANAVSSRWFKGTIKVFLIVNGAVSDYHRKLIYIYLRNRTNA